MVRRNGNGLTPLPTFHGSYQPAWSSDGSKLAGRLINQAAPGFPAMSRIFTANADGTGVLILSGPGDRLPTWSP